MITDILAKLRGLIDGTAPESGSDTMALQTACCGLLMEVARLESPDAERKRDAVAQTMHEQFGIAGEELDGLVANTARPDNRLTSYYRQVMLINKRYAPYQKAQFIERLWRVAIADGEIDMYEDQLIRTLADLLYVPHADFILAKHRVQTAGAG